MSTYRSSVTTKDYTDPNRVTTPMQEWTKEKGGLTGYEVLTSHNTSSLNLALTFS